MIDQTHTRKIAIGIVVAVVAYFARGQYEAVQKMQVDMAVVVRHIKQAEGDHDLLVSLVQQVKDMSDRLRAIEDAYWRREKR